VGYDALGEFTGAAAHLLRQEWLVL
jgi:hypothetical protein